MHSTAAQIASGIVSRLNMVLISFRRSSTTLPLEAALRPALVQLLPVLDLAVGLIAGYPVSFLDLADQFVALAVDLRERVVGELAPLLLDLTRHLLPVSFHTIPIHGALLVLMDTARLGATIGILQWACQIYSHR